MSSFAAGGQRRKKVTTYGRAKASAQYSLDKSNLFLSPTKDQKRSKFTVDNTSRALPSIKPRSSFTVASNASPTKASGKSRDVFDISSSDDDAAESNIPAPKKIHTLTQGPPAPESHGVSPKSRQFRSPSTEQEKFSSDASSASKKRKRGATQAATDTSLGSTTNGQSSQRFAHMMSVPYRPAQGSPSKGKSQSSSIDASLRIPSNQGSKVTKSQRNLKKTKSASKQSLNISKGISAPERLQAMVASFGEDEEWDDMLPPVEIMDHKNVTPRKSSVLPSTPPDTSSEGSHGRNGDSDRTPRQSQVWDKLLVQSDPSQTPSQLGLKNLRIGSPPRPNMKTLARAASDLQQATPKRKRLIDQFVRPPSSSSSSSISEDSDATDDQDVDMTDAEAAAGEAQAADRPLPQSSGATEVTSSDPNDVPRSSQTSSQPTMATGPKITYARDRSYLNEEKMDEDVLLETPLEMIEETKSSKRRGLNPYASSQKPAPIDEFGFDDDDTGGGGMRSIHELRAAGGNKRFQNDMENLLDDLSPGGVGSLSRQRSAMIELCGKLTETSFWTKIADHGFQAALFDKFASVSDPVLGYAVAIAIGLILNTGPSGTALEQLRDSGSSETLRNMLSLEADIIQIAKHRRTNMSRISQSSVSDLRSATQKSSIWGPRKPQIMSPRIVALKSLDSLVRRLRESGHMDPVLDNEVISELVEFTRISDGHDVTSVPESDLLIQELALSILESESLMPVAGQRQIAWPPDSIRVLSETLLPYLNSTKDATDTVELLAVRLFINLTNNNEKTCALFSKPTQVHSIVHSVTSKFKWIAEETDESTMDRLILALGALINLAEHSDAARAAVIVDGDQRLNDLVDTFDRNSRNAEQADSVEKAHANVANGYLAVALGNLCENARVRQKVRARLASGASPGLSILIRTVEEFIQYHQNVDGILRKGKDASSMLGDDGGDVWSNHTERLQCVVRRLKGFSE